MGGLAQRWHRLKAGSNFALAISAARYAAVRALLFLMVLLINPFGSSEAGDRLSHQIWQKIYADQYGDRTRKKAVDDITVVTIDDLSKEIAAPVDTQPDSAHFLQIFRTIAQTSADLKAQPKALFIDLLLGDFAPDETAASLLDYDAMICPDGLNPDRTHRFASVSPTFSPFKCMLRGIAQLTHYAQWKDDKSCFQNELAKLQCIARVNGMLVVIANATDPRDDKAGNPGPGALALATVAVSVPVLVNDSSYALVYPNDQQDRENRVFSLYPAAMLYAAWCAGNEVSCAPNPAMPPDKVAADKEGANWLNTWRWSPSFEKPLDVTWGIGAPDRFTNMVDSAGSGRMRDKCRIADGGPAATMSAFLQAWFTGLGFRPGTPCIYQHHVTYAQLLRISAGTSGNEFRASAFAGKIVLIGMEDKESGDFIAAGPHGKLPGVYYHAMALDNLIERGVHYPKTAYPILPPMTISNQDISNVFAAFLILLAVGVVHYRVMMRHAETVTRPWRDLGKALIVVGIVTIYMLVVLYVMAGKLSFLPDQFNIAAVGIVLAAEVLHVAAMLIVPALRPLLGRGLHVIAEHVEADAEPAVATDKRARRTKPTKQSKGVSDT